MAVPKVARNKQPTGIAPDFYSSSTRAGRPKVRFQGRPHFLPANVGTSPVHGGAKSVGSSREQRPRTMHKGKDARRQGNAGAVTEERLPRRNGGRIASYVTGVAQLPLNYMDVMNAEKAGAFFCPAHAKYLHLTSRDGGNVLNRRERFRPCRHSLPLPAHAKYLHPCR